MKPPFGRGCRATLCIRYAWPRQEGVLLASRGRRPGRTFLLELGDGTSTASARVLVTRSGVDFAPSRGDPRRLRARFSVFGLGVAFAARGENLRRRIYLHYLDPRGRRRRTYAV